MKGTATDQALRYTRNGVTGGLREVTALCAVTFGFEKRIARLVDAINGFRIATNGE